MLKPNDQPATTSEYVTVSVGVQLFGLPIARVQDVFMLNQITHVPLTADDITGIINLRGRIVTLIDLRRRLGMPGRERDAAMAVGIDCAGESYGFVIDAVGEVLRLGAETAEPVPVNIDERLKRTASGVHRLKSGLLVVLDIDRLLDLNPMQSAA